MRILLFTPFFLLLSCQSPSLRSPAEATTTYGETAPVVAGEQHRFEHCQLTIDYGNRQSEPAQFKLVKADGKAKYYSATVDGFKGYIFHGSGQIVPRAKAQAMGHDTSIDHTYIVFGANHPEKGYARLATGFNNMLKDEAHRIIRDLEDTFKNTKSENDIFEQHVDKNGVLLDQKLINSPIKPRIRVQINCRSFIS